jgi:hypothetical protein
VDFVAAVGAEEQAAAVVQPGEGAFDDPALAAEAGAVSALTACDHGRNAELRDQAAVLVVVVAAVGKQPLRPSPRAAASPAHCRDALEQLEQLGDVVAVGGGQRPGERDAASVDEQVVLASAPAAVDRARAGLGAPFFACR